MLATRMAPGQRTVAAPTLRHPRTRMSRLGSSRPKRLATVTTDGPNVIATKISTSMPSASGTPNVWKYGSRVKLRQNVAPAIVRPEPTMTCAVPPNIV